VTVSGRAQGVFYGDWTVQTAQWLGLTGWVRNREDGTVEALLQAMVRRMLEQMGEGRPAARVERVETRDCAAEPLAGFAPALRRVVFVHIRCAEHER
jgi:acylphosphatase